MNSQQLTRQLDRVTKRIRKERMLRRLTGLWLIAAIVGIVLLILETFTGRTLLTQILLAGAAIALAYLLPIVLRRSTCIGPRETARAIEHRWPDLNQGLLAALELPKNENNGRRSLLQQQVIADVFTHSVNNDWQQTVSRQRLRKLWLMQAVTLGLLLVVVDTAVETRTGRKFPITGMTTAGETSQFAVHVEPGDTMIERGTGLLVLARFDRILPDDVMLVIDDNQPPVQRITLTQSLDDPIFGGRVDQIAADISYHIEYQGHKTRDYRVKVFDYPQLEQADATIVFPDYTSLGPTFIADTRRVSMVESSSVTFDCRINKRVVSAQLKTASGELFPLVASDSASTNYTLTLTPQRSETYELELVDDAGRRNHSLDQFIVEVTPNRRPELKLVFPGRDLRVSPLEEVSLEASVWDDYGLIDFGLVYTPVGKTPVTILLGSGVKARETNNASHKIAFEQLDAKPDQLVSYYFFADDFGPDGKSRRTRGDLSFAEVRHFEEIFRQGQQPAGGASKQQLGGKNAQKINQLAKQQKEIVNATWKIIRRETSVDASEQFVSDVRVVSDAQQLLITQAGQMQDKLTNDQLKILLTTAIDLMQQASAELTQSFKSKEVSQLDPALGFEQSAYQAMLKLRAREHKVAQSQSGGGGGSGGGSRSQQQLNQLELTNRSNRYQSERQADNTKQTTASREQLQILNRLRELARRQQGVNEKLKELEAALREVQNDKDQDEIQRRLKRLRDEQQQMLRDLDELRNRMDRSDNQRQMVDSRRQVELTRSNLLDASKSLKQGQLSRALNSGTRAERRLNQLREDFRRKTAGQFDDSMKTLRNDSRELSQRQEKLSEQIDRLDRPKPKSLRSSDNRNEVQQQLTDQKKKLDDINQQMRKIISTAQQSEPLLSKQLYDTLRKSREQRPRDALEATAELVGRGMLKDAKQIESRARDGINTVRAGIEKAAQAVLGNEVDSLKRARDELKSLTRAVEKEMAASGPEHSESPHPESKSSNPNSASGIRTASAEKSQNGGRPKPGLGGGRKSQPGRGKSGSQPSSSMSGGQSGGPGAPGGPLKGTDFQQWSDRMRDVEELVTNPKLRNEVAKIRQRARSMRAEFKRHTTEPNWDLVRTSVFEPMLELRLQLAEEIARREPQDSLVPIDRDPVPRPYRHLVREYYERLGTSQ